MEEAGEGKRDTITSMNNSCKCLQETIRAVLKCLGLDTSPSQPPPAAHQISTSSSSSGDGDGDEKDGGDQQCSFQQLQTPADDPPPSTNDPPQPISLGRRPTRPGLGSSGGPQTNDTSS